MGTETKNKAGLVTRQNDAIYVAKSSLENQWDVLKTNVGGCEATRLFAFETEDQALRAARKIAEAIGGQCYGTNDPRKIICANYNEQVDKVDKKTGLCEDCFKSSHTWQQEEQIPGTGTSCFSS